uniref:Uncharacterized protein n=1 Tax=Romanomermis culicivorax TaxID=13658 RepID=A0A915IM41_ROMCU
HAQDWSAASRVSQHWTRKDSDVRKREKSATPEKERKRKHESRHQDESRHEKSMSREKKRRENKEESWCKEIEKSTKEEKKKRENRKNAKGAESHEVERGHWATTNTMIHWMCPTPVEQLYWIGLEPMKRLNKELDIAKYDGTSAAAFSIAAIPSHAISAGSTAILPLILGSARPPNAAAYHNPANS